MGSIFEYIDSELKGLDYNFNQDCNGRINLIVSKGNGKGYVGVSTNKFIEVIDFIKNIKKKKGEK